MVTSATRNAYYGRGLFTLRDSKGPARMDHKICKTFAGLNIRLHLNPPSLSGFFASLSSRARHMAGAQNNSDYLPFLFAPCYLALLPLRRASLTTKLLCFWHIQWGSVRGSTTHDGTSQTRSFSPVR
jgi:hypothetical protein